MGYLKNACVIMLAVFSSITSLSAENGDERVRTVVVNYQQGGYDVDTTKSGNGYALSLMLQDMKSRSDSTQVIASVEICSSASPEGGLKRNGYITDMRAAGVASILKDVPEIPDSIVTVRSVVENWDGLMALVSASDMKHKEEVMAILNDGTISDDERESRIVSLSGGSPYLWMSKNLFPQLRYTEMKVRMNPVKKLDALHCVVPWPELKDTASANAESSFINNDRLPVLMEVPEVEKGSFRMLLKTNGLSDLLATPSAGVEFHLGKRWSAGANLTYGWWTDRSKFFWRTFATDINLRKYLGKTKYSHPLQGHHIGIYAGVVTYDYELGGKGFISDYKESWSHYSGLDYGYSVPLTNRMNLDLTIGLGHVGGRYKEYLPDWDKNSQSMHYVWQSTKERNFWGPTRLEISLVWLIGKNK